MNHGQGAITPSTLPTPAGAPFPAGSANNGLSVDPGTGKIVLGNDVGDNIAALLSNREIPMTGHKINFISNGGETIGIDSSNGVFPSMYNILSRNIQATGYFSRNLSNGTAAGIFDSVFNDIGTNVTYGCMSSLYNQPGSYAPDSPFIQANNTAVTASLSFLSQGGFFWTPFGNNNVTQSAMRMFTTGNLQLNTIGTNPFIDSGDKLQVQGTLLLVNTLFSDNGTRLRISAPNGATQFFTAGQGGNVAIFNATGTDGITIDAALRQIATGSGTSTIQIAPGAAELLGVGIVPTEKLHVNGNIKTAAPGGAAGALRFGIVTAGAVVLDAANYLEVMINGVVKKVLLAA